MQDSWGVDKPNNMKVMPSANIQASSITSDDKGGGDSFIPSTPTRSRYSSPPPSISAIKPIHSPPPPPRRKGSIDGSEIITAESVLMEINSGHSIMNPKPVGAFSSMRSVRPRPRSASIGSHRTTGPWIEGNDAYMSVSPTTLPCDSTSSEEEEQDMPSIQHYQLGYR